MKIGCASENFESKLSRILSAFTIFVASNPKLMSKNLKLAILLLFLLPVSANLSAQKIEKEQFSHIADTLQSLYKPTAYISGKIQIDSVTIEKKSISLFFNTVLSEYPLREEMVSLTYALAKDLLPIEYSGYNVKIISNRSAIEDLIPPFYKSKQDKKISKSSKKRAENPMLIKRISNPVDVTLGLQDRHIAVWQSHGLYYEQSLMRWEWQRARIFQTVEDLYTQSYVLPFLVPMLENAGAAVLLPRERDTQLNEVIVDNDSSLSNYSESNGLEQWYRSDSVGFSNPKEFYLHGENPFTMGSGRVVKSIKKGAESSAIWVPDIPENGEYAVYVSYQTLPGSTSEAGYTVRYAGGESLFTINQQMGGGTWIYLGTFYFNKGKNENQFVKLTNITSKKGELITADAVKFGGGMGNIARKPGKKELIANNPSSSGTPAVAIPVIPFDVTAEISGYPRYTEGSRYWLQWAGFCDTIYSLNKNMNDYNDDYMSRGRWVNALTGGSRANPHKSGYGVPIDMSFSFHTDAGTTLNDSIVGTLAIYTRFSNDSDLLPTGENRITARYLTDLVQTQLVEDMRTLYEPIWQRRGLWDSSYNESRSPDVPAMLLEFLSHQNFADMRYGLDPGFRFHASRAIYKGILRYLSNKNGVDYIVQPLPVENFASDLQENTLELQWRGVNDTLEVTAIPKGYVVYTRINGEGFDNGKLVKEPRYAMQIESGKIYSFKVTAYNEGGESFPSEILSVYKSPIERGKVLIINGFDRVSAPASFATADTTLAGFADHIDHGMPYIKDYSYVGSQFEFERKYPWRDDDAPGFGASYSDYETTVIAGNTFDYPYIHGKAFSAAGYTFVSASRDGAIEFINNINQYDIVDLILGKQRQTKIGRGVMPVRYHTFPAALRTFIEDYANSGGNILISGADVGTDLWNRYEIDEEAQKFATEVLKYKWMTDLAAKNGSVKAAQSPYNFKNNYTFHTEPNSAVYCVESPDGIVPATEEARTIFRYSDNNISAGVAYKGNYNSVVLGFPIETLQSEEQIQSIINEIIKFFE